MEIRLIGELTVLRGGQTVPLPASKKTRALLAYLAATGKPQLREKLCGLLWDGPDDPRAALRWSLTKLRPIVEARLVADRERVELVPADAEIDLRELRRVAKPGAVAQATTETLRAAAVHARGELLEGLDLPDCYRYDEWLRGERESTHRLSVAISRTLVERLPPAEGLVHARAWVGFEPLDEAAHAAVIRALCELGRKAEALAQYASCARLIERELGRDPSREIERLRMAIGAVTAVVAEPIAAPTVSTDRPLVGRVQERAALAASLDANKVVLLLGDPGIGKSRLLEELAAIGRARGLTVLQGRGVEAEQVRPYGAWLDALGDDPFHVTTDRDRLFEAVAAALAARGNILVILDDVQWIDDGSAALLHYIARSSPAVRIACAARPGELADNAAALRLVRGLTREGAVHQIGLSPLDAAETAALAVAHAPGVDAARVFAESGGHPLFAVEIARALARGDTEWSSLEALLGERLELVEGVAREIVPWAAALGGAFDAELLATVTGVPLADLGRAIAELERRAILRVAGTEWDFVHDLVRTAAYRRVSEPRRRLLHLQIARSLASSTTGLVLDSAGGPRSLDDPDGERAVAIAHHAGLGGDAALCARASVVAGWRCLRLFATEEAAAHADRGLAHVARLTGETRASLRIDLLGIAIDADLRRTRRATLGRELERAIVDAQAAGAHAAAARGTNQLSYLDFESNDFASAQTRSHAAIDRARAADPVSHGRALAHSAQCFALLGRELELAEAMAREAATLLGTHDVAELPMALALIRHEQGDAAGALTLFARSAELAAQDGPMWLAGYSWSYLAMIELGRGRPTEALVHTATLAANAHRLGDASEIPFAAVVEAVARHALGEAIDLEAPLVRLRAADAPRLLSIALLCAARQESASGAIVDARRHAGEALEVARRADRDGDASHARALLAELGDA